MRPEPVSQCGLIDTSTGDVLHGPNRVQGIEIEAEAVVCQEKSRRYTGSALVTVDETMIYRDSKRVSGCEFGRIGNAVVRKVHWAGQSGSDHISVTNTVQPAMLGELAVMDRKVEARVNPTPLVALRSFACAQFASALNISRSSCMISSASFIWRANSGL